MELPFLSDKEKAKAAEAKDRIQNKILNPRVIVPLFAAVIVLLILGSAVTMHREKKQQNASTQVALSEEAGETLITQEQAKNINANIMLAFVDSTEKRLQMLGVLHVNSDENTSQIKYIDPAVRIKVNNFDGNMQEHYEHGGVSELIWALREELVTQIDRYIVADNENFNNFAKLLGEHEITVDESISYNYKGINFTIEEGTQKITPDMLQKYFTYLCDETYNGNEQRMSEMVAYLFSRFLNPVGDMTVEKMYDSIINYINTDISVFDLTDYSSSAISMLDDEGRLSIETV